MRVEYEDETRFLFYWFPQLSALIFLFENYQYSKMMLIVAKCYQSLPKICRNFAGIRRFFSEVRRSAANFFFQILPEFKISF